MCSHMLVAGARVVNTTGSALVEPVKYVNRMLLDRDTHVSFRQSDQGGLSQNITSELGT